MTILTPDDYATALRARIYRDGWHATARALGCAVTTLQNVTNRRNLPSDALLEATGYARRYRNGRGAPVEADAVRRRAKAEIDAVGTYAEAGDHFALSRHQLWTLVNGTKPPTPEALDWLGFTPVFVPVEKI